MAEVDVVVATRNRLDLTLETVRSVQAQTMTDWHLWLVDDGSDDGSDRALGAALADDARVSVLPGPWAGPEAARQRGLEAGSAPWVALVDSDDLWLPTKLERQLAATTGADLVLCWHEWFRPDGSTRTVRRPEGTGRVSPLLTDNVSTPLIARRLLVESGGLGEQPGMPPLGTCAHIETYLRLLSRATVAVVPDVLVRCRDHAGERTSGPSATVDGARQLEAVVRRHEGWLAAQWPREHAQLLGRTAARYLAAGCRRDGLRLLREAWSAAPRGERPRLLRSYAPLAARSLVPLRGSRLSAA